MSANDQEAHWKKKDGPLEDDCGVTIETGRGEVIAERDSCMVDLIPWEKSSWNHNHSNKLHMYKPQPTVVQWQSTGGSSQESWVQSPATGSSSSHLLFPQNIKCEYIDSLTTLVSCSWEVYEPSLEAAIAAWNIRERWEWFGGERLKHFSSVPFHRWRRCESVSCHQTGCSDGEQRCPPWTSLTCLHQHNQSNRSNKFNRTSHQELLC